MQKLKMLTDDQLVANYAKGSNEAFDVLLSRHQSRVFSYILHIVKNRDLADDIFQETFVKAIMTIKQGRYTENGKFSAWITRIAHNLIIDYYRQEKSEYTVSADDDDVNFLNRKDLCDDNIEDKIAFKFRVRKPYSGVKLVIKADGEVIKSMVKPHLLPAEMETIKLPKSVLKEAKELTFEIKED